MVETPLQTVARHYNEALRGIVGLVQRTDMAPEDRLARVLEWAQRALYFDPEVPWPDDEAGG